MEEGQPEIIANVPVFYAPADSFFAVSGVRNYTPVTPDPTFGPLRGTVGSPTQSILPTPDPASRSARPYSRASSVVSEEVKRTAQWESLDILVFMGSIRPERNADRVAKFIQNVLQSRNHRVTVVDPKENNMSSLVMPVHFYPSSHEVPNHLTTLNNHIQNADAFVVLQGEDFSSISPALSSLMNHFPPASYSHRPSAIVVYSPGQFGGIRASCQLRQYLSDLQTVHIPEMVVIPRVHEELDGKGNPFVLDGPVVRAADTMVRELEWYGSALKRQRQAHPRPSIGEEK